MIMIWLDYYMNRVYCGTVRSQTDGMDLALFNWSLLFSLEFVGLLLKNNKDLQWFEFSLY